MHQLNSLGEHLSKEERLPIWRALSDLFLDTEKDELTTKYIARTVKESGLSEKEVESILWFEVYPVLKNNLRSVAGVWSGWPDSWLLEHLQIHQQPCRVRGKSLIIKEIQECWSRIVTVLNNKKA